MIETKIKDHEHISCHMPRILMFAPGFAPYSFSENIVNSKLVLAFKEHGWDLDVISRVDEGPLYDATWSEPWLPLKSLTHTVAYPPGNKIVRFLDLFRQFIRVKYPVGGLRWAGRALKLALELHKSKKYQIVLSRSPNDIGHVPALYFSRQTKVPWVANWNDPPAHLWPTPYKSAEGLLDKITSQCLCENVFKEASFVTFPSVRLCDHILRSLNKNAYSSKTIIVPHIGLIGHTSVKRNPDRCFRICHAGNLSKERNPENFFSGIALFLKQLGINISFELRILGANDHSLDTLAEQYGLSKFIKVSGGLSYLNTLSVLEQSDVLAVVEAPCEEGIFLPSKVADYAQVGRPLLTVSPENSTLADLMRQTKAGEFANCNKPQDIANALMLLYTSWHKDRLSENYPSNFLWQRFSPESIVKKYEEMFNHLT